LPIGENVDVVIWSIIEVYTAMICASLTAIRPLLIKYIPSFSLSTTINHYNMSSSTIWKPRLDSKLYARIWSRNSGVESQFRESVGLSPTTNVGIYKSTHFEVTEISVESSSISKLKVRAETI
jgi:hypothetical protein